MNIGEARAKLAELRQEREEKAERDPGNANGPRLAKADPHKLKRRRSKAARKRNRGAYHG